MSVTAVEAETLRYMKDKELVSSKKYRRKFGLLYGNAR